MHSSWYMMYLRRVFAHFHCLGSQVTSQRVRPMSITSVTYWTCIDAYRSDIGRLLTSVEYRSISIKELDLRCYRNRSIHCPISDNLNHMSSVSGQWGWSVETSKNWNLCPIIFPMLPESPGNRTMFMGVGSATSPKWQKCIIWTPNII